MTKNMLKPGSSSKTLKHRTGTGIHLLRLIIGIVFYRHQPDLNYEEPAVRQEIFRIVDYWFSLGVDGLRMDAVPYLYETEGTDCENRPETHAFLKDLRHHVDTRFPNRMLLQKQTAGRKMW